MKQGVFKMSADFATMQINGRMTSDPKTFTVGETQKSVYSVAVNRRHKNKDGEWEKHTTFIDCVAWGNNSKHVAEYGKRGAKVVQTGRWETVRYQKDGEEVKRDHCNVQDVSIFTVRDPADKPAPSNDAEVPF